MTDKYGFIESEEGNYAVQSMCRWAGVSKSGYYEWKNPALTSTEQWRELMAVVVTDVFRDSDGTYGARRVAAEASRRGYPLDVASARKIMASQGLIAVTTRKRSPKTTIPAGGDYPDLVRRDFTAETVGTKLVGDITARTSVLPGPTDSTSAPTRRTAGTPLRAHPLAARPRQKSRGARSVHFFAPCWTCCVTQREAERVAARLPRQPRRRRPPALQHLGIAFGARGLRPQRHPRRVVSAGQTPGTPASVAVRGDLSSPSIRTIRFAVIAT